jgi:hypothetical protein
MFPRGSSFGDRDGYCDRPSCDCEQNKFVWRSVLFERYKQRRKGVPVLLVRLDAFDWHGWAEPLGGCKTVWRSSQYDFENAVVSYPS